MYTLFSSIGSANTLINSPIILLICGNTFTIFSMQISCTCLHPTFPTLATTMTDAFNLGAFASSRRISSSHWAHADRDEASFALSLDLISKLLLHLTSVLCYWHYKITQARRKIEIWNQVSPSFNKGSWSLIVVCSKYSSVSIVLSWDTPTKEDWILLNI